jgi:hypothetical protein
MAEDRHAPHSLKDQSADQIRNEQRGGANGPIDPKRDPDPEGNAELRQIWDQPGGEANNYRSAMIGAGGKSENHSDLTAAETPEATKHLSDAALSPTDKDATAEAIARATARNGNASGEG